VIPQKGTCSWASICNHPICLNRFADSSDQVTTRTTTFTLGPTARYPYTADRAESRVHRTVTYEVPVLSDRHFCPFLLRSSICAFARHWQLGFVNAIRFEPRFSSVAMSSITWPNSDLALSGWKELHIKLPSKLNCQRLGHRNSLSPSNQRYGLAVKSSLLREVHVDKSLIQPLRRIHTNNLQFGVDPTNKSLSASTVRIPSSS
jgi:hypothetical protein